MAGATNQNAAMKKSRAKARPAPTRNTASDEIATCCQRIETLAGLLETFDWLDKGDSVNPRLIGYTGLMITTETASLRRWLDKLPRR